MDEDKIFGGLVIGAMLVLVSLLIIACGEIAATKNIPIIDRAEFKSGESAAKLGLPANSNPYMGATHHTKQAEWWLEGYMSAKKGELTAESK